MMIDPYRVVCTGRLFPEQARGKSYSSLFFEVKQVCSGCQHVQWNTLCPFRIGYLECCISVIVQFSSLLQILNVSVNSAYTLEGTAFRYISST